MIRPIYFLTILCFAGLKKELTAQNCTCTIKEVETNSVTPCDKTIGEIVTVSSTIELKDAIRMVNNEGGNKTILISDGIYPIATSSWYPYITASNVVFRSLSGNRDAVIITGTGMKSVAPETENGFYLVGNNVTIADLTIKDVGNHGIATHGDNLFVHNVKIQDTFEQMVKGTSAEDGADQGIVQCSLFEYPDGIGPQWYIGGLDIHEGQDWVVRDNVFKNISSPSNAVAEHAVHFWNHSSNNIVERNAIFNCDRGIGFGLGSSPNDGGIIRNNIIYNDGSGLFNDVGIGLETSPNTKVYNNTIHVAFQNAIEYRFAETENVIITNNLTNKRIRSRNNGQANLYANYENAEENWYEDLSKGNLRIQGEIAEIVDQGTDLMSEVVVDIDQNPRSLNGPHYIGAHEFLKSTNTDDKIRKGSTSVFPNPSNQSFTIVSDQNVDFDLLIFDSSGNRIAILRDQLLQSGLTVDTEEWPAGIYECRLISSNRFEKSIRVLVTH